MVALLTWLTSALKANPVIALVAAFVWGILSVVLSPCHLASIPLIVGYVGAQGHISVKRAFWISLVFSVGILVTICLIGLITALAGRLIGDIGLIGKYIVALLLVIVGLYLLDIIPLRWSGFGGQQIRQRGLVGALLLGLIFGVALGPCTFAYMAPMLAVVFNVAASQLHYAISLLIAFAIGHCSILILAGTLTETVGHYLHWTEKSKGVKIVKRICGLLVILGGVYLIIMS